jgi:DNA polymerase-3 subunit gamma/tau
MSYLVLARKYRPRNFSEMVGQEHVVRALSNALDSKRLHHAYLFTGTRGVGKTTVSRILAKSLNCQGVDGQGGITATPCGVCQACTDIDSGRFVDYTELDAASNRGVDEVQALLEQAVYKPVQGRFKVFMIDEVHMLTGHAFNAMLKTLEEPPEYLKFVLATTDPQKVPVTVLSRCLQFNLRPMAPETIREHLVHVLQIEGVSADAQALRLLARAARGSMRDALSLTDQAIAFGNGQIEVTTVRQMLGSVDRSYVFRLIEALAKGDGKTVVETSEALRLNGLSAASTLEEMSTVLQRMAVLQAVAVQDEDTDPDAVDTARLAALMPPDETQLLYSICLHGRSELGLAPDDYAALTMVLLRLLAFKPAAVGVQAAARVQVEPLANSAAEKKTLKPAEAGVTDVRPTSVAAPPSSPSNAPPAQTLSPQLSPPFLPPFSPPFTHTFTPPFSSTVAPPAASIQARSVVRVPPGRELHVVDQPHSTGDSDNYQSNEAAGQEGQAYTAAKIVAVPVRVQADSRAENQVGQSAAGNLKRTEEGDFWHPLVQQLIAQDAITALVRELALQSQLVARDTDQWILRVERESLNQSGTGARLQAALQAAGHDVKLVVEVGRVGDSPARRNAAAAAERQLAAEKIIFDDPFVQSMMRDFGAKIVPGSIKPA